MCCTCVAFGEALRTTVGGQVRVPAPNATAAYSLDPDCAEAEVAGGFLVVTGQHICTTRVVLVGGNGTTDILVAVTRRENHLPESRIAAGNGQESGSIASFYSSN